jgi:hypothetical protein
MNFQDTPRMPGWGKGTSWKIPGWEQIHPMNFQETRRIPGWGKGTSWKSPACEKVHQINTKKSLKNSGLATWFIQATEENGIPGQEKFDH